MGSPNPTPTGALQQTFGYDPAGNLQNLSDFDGRQATLSYDGAGRLTTSVNSYSSSSITGNASYDPNGNPVGWQTTSGSQSDYANATYNAANWLTSTNDDGLVASYGDAEGASQPSLSVHLQYRAASCGL